MGCGRRQTMRAAVEIPTSSNTPAVSSQRPATCHGLGSWDGAGLVTGPEPAPTANAKEPASRWPSSAETIRQPARYEPSPRVGRVAANTSGRPSGWRTGPRRTWPLGPCRVSPDPSGRTASEKATRSSAGTRAIRAPAGGLLPTTRACRRPLTGDAHDGAGRVRACGQPGRGHELGDPVGADPRVRDLRGGAGGGVQGRDGPAAPRRLPPLAGDGLRARRGLLVVLVCGGGDGALGVRKGADFTAAMAFQFASTNLVIE